MQNCGLEQNAILILSSCADALHLCDLYCTSKRGTTYGYTFPVVQAANLINIVPFVFVEVMGRLFFFFFFLLFFSFLPLAAVFQIHRCEITVSID